MKKNAPVLAGVAALAWSAGAMAAEPITINAMLPLTGPGAFLGGQEKTAIELIQKLVNQQGGIKGQPVEFAFQDDQTNPQVAVQIFQQINASGPSVFLGSALTATCAAVAPMLQNGPVQYCFSPVPNPPLGSFSFTAGVASRDAERVAMVFAREKGWTRVAAMISTDATGQDAERGVTEAVNLPENKSISLVEVGRFNPTDVTVTAQIERIRAAHPQVLMVWSTGAQFATVLKGVVQAGLDIPVLSNYGNMTYLQMKQYADFLPKDLYFPASIWPKAPAGMKLDSKIETAKEDFYRYYEAAGVKPDAASGLAWDATLAIVDSLRQLGPKTSAAAIRDHLVHLKGFGGVNGLYDFEKYPQRGLGVENVVVTRWNGASEAWEWASRPGGVPFDR
jgi:branched-chain amino acid transport system substrate-binding protein